MGALAVKILNETVGAIWLERNAVVTIDDIAVCNRDGVTGMDVPSVLYGCQYQNQ